MFKYCQRRQIFSVPVLSLCFLCALVFTDYYEISEVDCFSSNLVYESIDLPTLSNLEKSKTLISPADTDYSLLGLYSLEHITDLRTPTALDEKISGRLRC
jgi:hypothetical protein